MFKLYTTLTTIWHNRVAVPAGEVVAMTDEQAKYLKHALEEVKDRAVDVIEEIQEGVVEVIEAAKGRRNSGASTTEEAPKEKL